MMKKTFALIMTASLLLLPLGALAAGIGDSVWFGRYPYYCNSSASPEPIEWLIADEQDGWWLLITAHIIDCGPAVGLKSLQPDHFYALTVLDPWAADFDRVAFSDQEREMMKGTAFILTEQQAAALPASLRVCTSTPYAGSTSYWWTKQQHSAYGPQYDWVSTASNINTADKYSAINSSTGQADHVYAYPKLNTKKRGAYTDHEFKLTKRGMRPAVWVKIPENR